MTRDQAGESVLDPRVEGAKHRDTSGYKPSDLSFPQNEIFNNSGLNQIFFITPLQKEIEMEFILDEK